MVQTCELKNSRTLYEALSEPPILFRGLQSSAGVIVRYNERRGLQRQCSLVHHTHVCSRGGPPTFTYALIVNYLICPIEVNYPKLLVVQRRHTRMKQVKHVT